MIDSPKKIFFKNSKNLTLVGSFYPASTETIVIMAHGSSSNRFARGVFDSIAKMLCDIGYSVLAFDFSGHGESDDEKISLKVAADDVHAAIAYVKNQHFKHIVLFGHSLGAYACLRSFCKEVETMVLMGALTGPVHWRWEDMCSPSQLKAMHRDGYVTNPVNDGLREIVKVDVNLLKEIAAIDPQSLCNPITCPVLIIHGDADQPERDLLDCSRKTLPFLPNGSELTVIQGASHAFVEHVDVVMNLTKTWITKHAQLYRT